MPLKALVVAFLLVNFAGCATNTYEFGTGRSEIDYPKSPHMDEQFIYGKPNAFLDASDWIWPGSLLGKLFLWNKNVDSHEIAPETVAYLEEYIKDNELEHVQVLVNSYSPGVQYRRLFQNKTVGAGWRYTIGFISVTLYAILPGRFFGGDHYNPYTNTISLYSNDTAIALHEAGHAKDTGKRKLKGTHAFMYSLPLSPLYYEANATRDALSYVRYKQRYDDEKEFYKTLHPAYGTYTFGALGLFFPVPAAFGAIPGHISGAIQASRVEENDVVAEVEQNQFTEIDLTVYQPGGLQLID